jgi:hypothetical protein
MKYFWTHNELVSFIWGNHNNWHDGENTEILFINEMLSIVFHSLNTAQFYT